MTQVIETPGGIEFAAFYYPEIYRELLQFLRLNKERIGLTDENIYEVHTQLMAAFANVGHLANTRLDTVATELLIDSAALLESVKRLLRLMGIELRSAAPATADVVMKLSEVTSVNLTSFIPVLAEFATDSTPPISYEDLDGSDLDRTDRVSYAYGLQQTDSQAGGGALIASSSAPDTLTRTTGSWSLSVVGQHLFLGGTPINGGGEYRVVERLSSAAIRLATVPRSETPSFQTESIPTWSLKAFTADGASDVNTGGVPTFTPWSGAVVAGDMFFVAHKQAQWTRIDIDSTVLAAAPLAGVWEYYDGELSSFPPFAAPDIVSLPGQIVFNVNTLLGTASRAGALVRVTYLPTGASETVNSTFSGGVNKATTSGLLGQVTPSTNITDYAVTATWVPFANATDTSNSFQADGNARWDLPQTAERKWSQTEVNLVSANWARFRVITGAASGPTLDTIDIDQGDQYLVRTVTQGETIGPQIIGSSTGVAFQEFVLPETPYLDDTEAIEVDEGGAGTFIPYTRVDSFKNSGSTSRNYVREVDSVDKATIRFGDGINGKIPPAGVQNIRATYRIGGDVDGNVGIDTISINSDGVTGISDVTNPRPAENWRIKDGGNTSDLERVKRDGPAGLRTRDTASTADDVVRLATKSFTDSDGAKPVVRALAEEERYGVKTIGLTVVGSGGATLTTSQLDQLEEYFNGDRFARPPVSGVLVTNHEVIASNYEPALISIVVSVIWPGGNADSVRNQLLSYLTPLATESDGITYVWDFGDQVSASKLYQLIHDIDPKIRDVPNLQINGGANCESYNLTGDQLPYTTAASIAVTIRES